MKHQTRLSYQSILLIIIFIASYFFYDFIELNKIVALLLVGMLVAVGYFILQRSMPFYSKIGVLILLFSSAFLIPFLIVNQNKLKKFKGIWQTDATDGFSIEIRIHEDSVYLSQSNITGAVPYKMKVTEHKFSISNKVRGKELEWEYYFENKGNTLVLFNVKDSLKLTRLK